MFFRGLIDPVTATAPLRQAIESGKLGVFTVDKDSFTVMSPTPTPTGGYSHMSRWSLRETVLLLCHVTLIVGIPTSVLSM